MLRRQRGRFSVTLIPDHHRPGHPGDLVGQGDSANFEEQASLWSGFFLAYALLYASAAVFWFRKAKPAGTVIAAISSADIVQRILDYADVP